MTPDSPEPFADDDTMLEFARGYAPPTYESPPGIFFESPPQLDTGTSFLLSESYALL